MDVESFIKRLDMVRQDGERSAAMDCALPELTTTGNPRCPSARARMDVSCSSAMLAAPQSKSLGLLASLWVIPSRRGEKQDWGVTPEARPYRHDLRLRRRERRTALSGRALPRAKELPAAPARTPRRPNRPGERRLLLVHQGRAARAVPPAADSR